MEAKEFTAKLYFICDSILKLIYINILWILFTLIGLGIFGIMPATVSLFHILNKVFNSKDEANIFSEYLIYYKANFTKANLLGLILILIGIILWIDVKFSEKISNKFIGILVLFANGIAIIYSIMLLYIFPIYSRYKITIFQIIKNSFLISLMNPGDTLLILLSMYIFYTLCIYVPTIIPILSVSLFGAILTLLTKRIFRKIEKQK